MTVYAQKTRLVMQVRARFAGAVVRRNWLECAVPFPRQVEHPRFIRTDSPAKTDGVHWIHYFRLMDPNDVDDEVRSWLAEAYRCGSQARFAES